MRSFGAVAVSALALLGGVACSRDAGSTDGNTTTTSTTVDDTSSGGMTETSTDTDDDTAESSPSTGSFYAGPAPDTNDQPCDPWLQDCPEGEKCVPYSTFSGSGWNANKCVPVIGDGQPGDPCISGGPVEASDDCDATSVCWDYEDVDGENLGTCTPLCTGSPEAPVCPESTACLIANSGSITLCLPTCDPLVQDCADGYGCYWKEPEFLCLSHYTELVNKDPCGFLNDCPPGDACVDACLLGNCCVSFCSITSPDCAGFGAECVPFFDPDPPAGYEDVGLCTTLGCDPFAQDCPDGLACLWLKTDFECAVPGAVGLGQPCTLASDCAAGSLCLDESSLPSCAGESCCAGLCSLAQPSCTVGTECVGMFGNDPPAGYEDVGACISP